MLKIPCPATGTYLLDIRPIAAMWLRWIKVTDRIEVYLDKSSKFLPYQLSMVVYWTTMAVTGNGELGFDSGEGAWETATTTTVRQQGRKLANPNSGSQWQEIASWETYVSTALKWEQCKSLSEEQLEGKSWCQQPR